MHKKVLVCEAEVPCVSKLGKGYDGVIKFKLQG